MPFRLFRPLRNSSSRKSGPLRMSPWLQAPLPRGRPQWEAKDPEVREEASQTVQPLGGATRLNSSEQACNSLVLSDKQGRISNTAKGQQLHGAKYDAAQLCGCVWKDG
mmetsp:Transcript_91132/g.190588  ORF Transcript_91132/g.190588 Transcript_91132/m.190588 type:complete len:108 (-) Transcript_91132:283-606(-)